MNSPTVIIVDDPLCPDLDSLATNVVQKSQSTAGPVTNVPFDIEKPPRASAQRKARRAKRLFEQGLHPRAIAKRIGKSEAWVRTVVKPPNHWDQS